MYGVRSCNPTRRPWPDPAATEPALRKAGASSSGTARVMIEASALVPTRISRSTAMGPTEAAAQFRVLPEDVAGSPLEVLGRLADDLLDAHADEGSPGKPRGWRPARSAWPRGRSAIATPGPVIMERIPAIVITQSGRA